MFKVTKVVSIFLQQETQQPFRCVEDIKFRPGLPLRLHISSSFSLSFPQLSLILAALV